MELLPGERLRYACMLLSLSNERHGISSYFTLTVSMRQVQRINRKKGVCRKPQKESPLEDIERAILVNQLTVPGCLGMGFADH